MVLVLNLDSTKYYLQQTILYREKKDSMVPGKIIPGGHQDGQKNRQTKTLIQEDRDKQNTISLGNTIGYEDEANNMGALVFRI